jgi:hypothetical protein
MEHRKLAHLHVHILEFKLCLCQRAVHRSLGLDRRADWSTLEYVVPMFL